MKSSWMPYVLVAAMAGAGGFALGRSTSPTAPPALISSEATLDRAGPDLPAVPEDPEPVPPAAPAAHDGSIEGTLRDHVDVAQYTYLHIALEAGDTWAAVYKTPVKDGQHVVVEHAAKLAGFHSRELNRDFSEIWFGSLPAGL